jgi:integrase
MGQLFFVRKSWSFRYWTVIDGRRKRRCVSLDTDDHEVAKARASRLERGSAPDQALAPETFEQAARRIVDRQTLRTRDERLSRLERYAIPTLGPVPVTRVRPAHIRGVLDAAAATGLARTTVEHLKSDVSAVLKQLWRDEAIAEDWTKRVLLPAARVDSRPRVLLSDAEFEAFQASPVITDELKLMGLAARVLGGMRTSELHAWDWRHVDTEGWLTAEVVRVKTKTRTLLQLPDQLVGPLHLWWLGQACPKAGPVFPDRWGERRIAKSWAFQLRGALWRAGIRRSEIKNACPLQSDTPETRCVDFHSFRRAYNTGLARAGVNVQTAMKLAGHTKAATHMKYVLLSEALATPEGALPRRGA